MDEKQQVFEFLTGEELCVLSTQGEGPESALVAFSENERLEVVFGTFTSSRKYKNLLSKPLVSLVIGTTKDKNITVQYEGKATELRGEERARAEAQHVKKIPASKKYAVHPEQTYFLVRPTWIRYTDYNKGSEKTFELTL